MRIAVYSRQSTENDRQVERHVERCQEEAAGRGWEVTEVYRDNGISGYKRKVRPGYEALLAAVAAGEVDGVLAVTLDRLFRNDKERVRFADVMEAAGVSLVPFVDDPDIDLSTAAGRRDFRDAGSAAMYVSDRLAEKMRDVRFRQARDGLWMGPAPFGYRTGPEPGTLVVDKEQAAVIRECVEAVRRGVPPHRIAVELRSRGVKTARGNDWNRTRLHSTLQAPTLAGLAVYGGKVLVTDGKQVHGQWEPIITEAEHEMLKERLKRGATPRHPKAVGISHPLSGLTVCGRCGTVMIGGPRQYLCPGIRGGCGLSVSVHALDSLVFMKAFARLTDPDVLGTPTGIGGTTMEQADEAAAELTAVATKRAALTAAVDAEVITKADAAKQERELAKREKAATELLGRPVAVSYDIRKVFDDMKARWQAFKNGDTDAAKLLHDDAGLVIERVTVNPSANGKKSGPRFDPNRVEIHWHSFSPWVQDGTTVYAATV